MGDVISFPEQADEIRRLVDRLEDAGLTVSIIRYEHKRKGELAFSMLGAACRNTPDVIAAMSELNMRFSNDVALRLAMYEEYFSIGGLFYEASTSSAVSFDEKEPLRL